MKERAAEIQRIVGAAVGSRRRAIGVPQETLAAAVGLSRSSIANIERGRQKIGVTLLYLIADALQTTPHDLLPPQQGKPAAKSGEVALPKSLPAEERDWIRGVLDSGKGRKRGGQ